MTAQLHEEPTLSREQIKDNVAAVVHMRLVALMQAQGLSVYGLAIRAGLPISRVWALHDSPHDMKLSTLARLAVGLDVGICELLDPS